jgi:transposase
MSNLRSKIRQYRRLQSLLPKLEQEIKAEAYPLLKQQGLLMQPRIERIVEQFG